MALSTPFATTEDLEAGWRPLADAEETRATTLLKRASQKILDADRRGLFAELTEPTQSMKDVVCEMVRRAMPVVDTGTAVTQESRSWGPFSTAHTFATPSGNLYLTKDEQKQLGLLRQRAGGVNMWAGAYDDPAA